MNLQVLVSTMNHKDIFNLLEKMNINSDAIIINQCDNHNYEKLNYKEHIIHLYSFAERGIGLSRNNALMRATADICLFADDDVTYVDDYKDIIVNAFKKKPEADMILFNVPSTNSERPTYRISSEHRVRLYNCLRYGAVNIAVKTEKIRQKNIYFSLLFGGGAKYSSGEDSLFIADCIRKGVKVYTNPTIIGYVNQEKSSWFEGYTDKYFIDKGVFFKIFSDKWAKLLSLQFVLRHRKKFSKQKNCKEAYTLMKKGIKMINQ